MTNKALMEGARKRWPKILAFASTVALIATNIEPILSVGEKAWKWCCTPEVNMISASYMRLSGAFEVPVFVQILSAGGLAPGTPIPTIAPKDEQKGYEIQSGHISASLADFWQKSAHKDAKPIATALWRQVAGSGMLGHRLLYEAGDETRVASVQSPSLWAPENSTQDLACALWQTVPYMMPSPSFRTVIPQDVLQMVFQDEVPIGTDFRYKSNDKGAPIGCKREISRRIGFLFLVIENPTKNHLSDVALSFHRIEPAAMPISTLEKWEKADIGKVDRLVKSEIDKLTPSPKLSTIKVPSLGEKDKLIWLISIYRTNGEQFEDKWLRPWELPVEISFTAAGKKGTAKIRLPHRHGVAPVPMPFGWYEQ